MNADSRRLSILTAREIDDLYALPRFTEDVTVLRQTARGLAEKTVDGDDQHQLRQPVLNALESIKWYLWHGNVFQALKHLDDLQEDLAAAADILDDVRTGKLLGAVEEFHAYTDNNREFISNYGERYRHGETISTATAESTVNQVISKRMVKRQQMQWSQRGAHLLLQTRTRVLNDELEGRRFEGGIHSFGQKCLGRHRLKPDPPVFSALESPRSYGMWASNLP